MTQPILNTRNRLAAYMLLMQDGDLITTKDLADRVGIGVNGLRRYLNELRDPTAPLGKLAAQLDVFYDTSAKPYTGVLMCGTDTKPSTPVDPLDVLNEDLPELEDENYG